MNFFVMAGFAAALLIGLTLGLTGGGGSILAVPIFTFLFDIDAVTATAYSLFVVGVTSALGALKHYKAGNVACKTAFVFTFPSLIAVWGTRKFLVPAIPSVLFSFSGYSVTKDIAIILLFAIVMLPAAFFMIYERKEKKQPLRQVNYPLLFTEAFFIGILSGLIGAGGGFLIIPALILLVGLPMKKAVGTSLMVIAVNSLLGFTADLLNPEINHGNGVDWHLLVPFTLLAVVGIFAGVYLSKYVSEKKLKKLFGYFVLTVAVIIVFERFILLEQTGL